MNNIKYKIIEKTYKDGRQEFRIKYKAKQIIKFKIDCIINSMLWHDILVIDIENDLRDNRVMESLLISKCDSSYIKPKSYQECIDIIEAHREKHQKHILSNTLIKTQIYRV